MTPEQFLKKWLPVAEHVFKDMKLTMKDDLEAVIRTENQSLQNVIDRQAEDLRCFENQGHIDNWGEEMIRRSRNANGDWIQQATRGYRPDEKELARKIFENILKSEARALEVNEPTESQRPDNQLIVDCDYPAETLTTKTYSVSGSINKTVKVPEDKFDSLLEALKKCPDKRVEL